MYGKRRVLFNEHYERSNFIKYKDNLRFSRIFVICNSKNSYYILRVNRIMKKFQYYFNFIIVLTFNESFVSELLKFVYHRYFNMDPILSLTDVYFASPKCITFYR